MKSIITSIFILEDDSCLRSILDNVCSKLAKTTAVDNVKSAVRELTCRAFGLLLLDWHLIFQPNEAIFLLPKIDRFQPDAVRIALFSAMELQNTVEAFKSGFKDVLWLGHDKSVIERKIREFLDKTVHKKNFRPNLGHISDLMIENAFCQKTPFFQTRKLFSKIFLQQLMDNGKLQNGQIVKLMGVSYKTLDRLLYP